MNLKNAQVLIDRLKTCEDRDPHAWPKNSRSFNLATIRFPCGSPACVAGHCADLMDRSGGADVIADFLDIDEQTAETLFFGRFSKREWKHEITVAETVAFLEKLMREAAQ